MDFFTKNKMLFWCIAVLVILNVATLTAFWTRRPPLGPRQRAQTPGGGKIMEERLQLDGQQIEQVELIRQEHFQRTRPLHEQMHKIRLDILAEQFTEQPDEQKMNQWCAELGKLQTQFEENLSRHFQELRGVCNPEQTEELKIMLRDLVERSSPKPPQQHPPGRRPGPGLGPDHMPLRR